MVHHLMLTVQGGSNASSEYSKSKTMFSSHVECCRSGSDTLGYRAFGFMIISFSSGSVLAPDSIRWSRIQRAKMTHKNREKVKKFRVLMYWMLSSMG
jgi:hypothetical protein